MPDILLGLIAGILSGLVGMRGGIIIVPALVFLFGMTQHNAQGTTLALLIPSIGVIAAWTYYRAGYVDVKVAGLITLGFIAGSFLGAQISTNIPDVALERIFASQ